MTPSVEWRIDHKHVCGAVALAHKIVSGRLSRAHRERCPGFIRLLLRDLVHADQQGLIVIIPIVDVAHILHAQTKSAFVFDGMHQHVFSQSLKLFSKIPPYCFLGNNVNNLEYDKAPPSSLRLQLACRQCPANIPRKCES